MAYSLRADGLSDVHLPDGTVMPMALSPQQLQAMGHTEIAANAQRPQYSDERVAGPGGGPASPFGIKLRSGVELPDSIVGGGGVPFGQSAPSDKFAGVRVKLGGESDGGVRDLGRKQAAAEEYNRVESMRPAERMAYLNSKDAEKGVAVGQAPELAPHSATRGGEQPASDGALTLTPEQELAFREATRGGGGPVKSSLALGKRTEKYTTYGKVPDELSADINKRGDALEAKQTADLDSSNTQREQLLARRDAQYTQQMDDVIDQRMQRQAVNDRIQQLQQTRDQREQEVATMPPPDLQRYWGEKGVASQVMTGLSIALGGYVQGLRGGDNPGLEMANRAIDTWMKVEREKYDRASDTAKRADSQYGQALALYGTPEMAENDMRARAYAVRDSMLANQLDQIGNADAYAKGQEALQQGSLQRQQLKAQAFQLAGEKAVEDTLQQRTTGGGGSGNFLKGLKAAAEAKQTSDYLNGKTDVHGKPLAGAAASPLAVRFPDGSVAFAGNSKEKTQSQKAVRSAWGGMNDIDRLIQLTGSASSRAPGADEQGQAEALAAALLLKVHDAHGIATFQQATSDVMHEMLGNPTQFFRNPKSVAKLREVRRGLEDVIHEQKKFLAPSVSSNSEAPDDSELPDSAQEVVE
jgi:hypothetical protein